MRSARTAAEAGELAQPALCPGPHLASLVPHLDLGNNHGRGRGRKRPFECDSIETFTLTVEGREYRVADDKTEALRGCSKTQVPGHKPSSPDCPSSAISKSHCLPGKIDTAPSPEWPQLTPRPGAACPGLWGRGGGKETCWRLLSRPPERCCHFRERWVPSRDTKSTRLGVCYGADEGEGSQDGSRSHIWRTRWIRCAQDLMARLDLGLLVCSSTLSSS